MTRYSIFALFFSALMLTVGCGGKSLDGSVEDLYNELEAQGTIICDCYVEFGIPSREMCEAFWFSRPTPEQQACVVDAMGLDRATSQTAVDCLLAAERDYTDCAAANLDCANDTSLDPCNNTYNAAIMACPDFTPEVDAAGEACFPA